MNLIVAVDNNWAIGNKGDLLARVRADLRYFAAKTTGNVVVLGSKTLATFPGGRALKNRTNIVMSTRDISPEGTIVVHSLEELLEETSKYPSESVYVIGGASVYNQLLPFCDTAYVTKFD
ncbi:MAG: dihydrofolate reductase, partial [Clostridia bacterium]|nr:dihydrofolate reductase [Clostridia bacterium]